MSQLPLPPARPWPWRWALGRAVGTRGGLSLAVLRVPPTSTVTARGPQGSMVPSALHPRDWAGGGRALSWSRTVSPGAVPGALGAGFCTCKSQGRMQARCCNKQAQAQLSPAHTCVSPRGQHSCSWAAALRRTLRSRLLRLWPISVDPASETLASPTGKGLSPTPCLPAREAGKLGPGRKSQWGVPEAGA